MTRGSAVSCFKAFAVTRTLAINSTILAVSILLKVGRK
jgi:hypothetical protein